MGYEYSPYWEPFQDSIELEYCRQIGEWWKALDKQKVSTVECSGSVCKQHLLISEASPDLPPMGFFNCTVEVSKYYPSWADPEYIVGRCYKNSTTTGMWPLFMSQTTRSTLWYTPWKPLGVHLGCLTACCSAICGITQGTSQRWWILANIGTCITSGRGGIPTITWKARYSSRKRLPS